MKRFFVLIIAALLCLSGCNSAVRGNTGQEIIIASMGFDFKDGEYSVIYETITVNSEDSSEPKKTELLEGIGTTFSAAVEDINRSAVRPFLFSHAAVAVLGNGINQKQFREIRRFLYAKDEINISLKFVNTTLAKKLLSCERKASVAVGYDLSDSLDEQEKLTGIKYKSKLYDIEASERKNVNVLALPCFTVENKGYSLKGVTVYKEYAPILKLSKNEAEVYSLLTSSRKKGNFFYDNKIRNLLKARTDYSFSYGESLEIDARIRLKFDETTNLSRSIAETAGSLFEASQSLRADIFGFGNNLASLNPDLWERLKHSYYNEYSKSKIEVTVIEEN